MSGVPSYGTAEAEVILIKMRQGVKKVKNKFSTKRRYLEGRKRRRDRLLALRIWTDRENMRPVSADCSRADTQVAWGLETGNTGSFFSTWPKPSGPPIIQLCLPKSHLLLKADWTILCVIIGGHLTLIKVVIIYLDKQSCWLTIAKPLAFRLKNTFRLYWYMSKWNMSISCTSFNSWSYILTFEFKCS